jgi:hypothetical protein
VLLLFFFFFYTNTRLTLGPTLSPTQQLTAALSEGLSGRNVKLYSPFDIVPGLRRIELSHPFMYFRSIILK